MTPSSKKKAVPELVPLFLLEDEPVPSFEVDELQLLPFAKVVAGAAVGTKGPFTIGVYGDWGHGKTSVLRQAKTLLDKVRPDLVTVWFNAWQYESEEHPLIPLAATVVQAVDAKLAEKTSGLKSGALKALKDVGDAVRAIVYGISAKVKVGVPGFAQVETDFVPKEIIERYEKLAAPADPLVKRTLYYNTFETLQKAAASAAGAGDEGGIKIVVFIDDLDRCLPPQGVKLLESIKLVLAQPGFVFVLALDRRVLEGYLARRYRKEFGVADYAASGTQYLDKIVQLPLGLPTHRSRFAAYVQGLLNRDIFSRETNAPVKKVLEGLIDVLAVGSNYNPRSLVRFINNLIVDRGIWREFDPERRDVEVDLLGVCAVSRILRQHLGEHHYRILVENDDLCGFLAETSDDMGAARDSWGGGEEKRALDYEHRLGRDVLSRLEELPFLRKLLATNAGKRWLGKHEERQRVNEFLSSRPAEEPSPARVPMGAAAIEQAIREKLGTSEVTEQNLATITELSLRGRGLDDRALARLKVLTALQGLGLSDNQITGAGLEHLKGHTALRHLDLSGNQIRGAGLEHLKGLTALQGLGLSGNQITGSGLKHLKGLTALQDLYLSDNQITDAGLEHLKDLTALQDLRLSGNQITHAGLEHLKGLTTLRHLDLSGNQITDAGLERLKGLTALEDLDLSNNQITDAGLEHLKGLTALQALGLSRNQITDAGLGHLKGLTALQELYLSGNQITDAGLEHLKGLTALQALGLSRNQITDAGLEHLKSLAALKSLVLPQIGISRKHAKSLFPQCEIEWG
jgi:Leucine-rich repeat (LRR) protein